MGGVAKLADEGRRTSMVDPRLGVIATVTRVDRLPSHWQSVNLSEGGVYLRGSPILQVGTRVQLGLRLEQSGAAKDKLSVKCWGRVAWINEPHQPRKRQLPSGMGLSFVDVDGTTGQTLRRYLSGLQAEADFHAGEMGDSPPPMPSRTLPAETVVGNYRILSTLGVGGMGSVYLAEHMQLHRRVALKHLHQHYSDDTDRVRRFFNEARLVNQIGHPNIVEITDFIAEGKNRFLVMEYIEGTTLASMLCEQRVFTVADMVHIGVQLCDALAAIHAAGILHRDLKPGNIMFTHRGQDKSFLKLLDFGIARFRDGISVVGGEATTPGVAIGTPGYMAPEQLLQGRVDHTGDIYALGVLLYCMATGQKPFVGETWHKVVLKQADGTVTNPSSICHFLPPALEALILACIHPDPKQRPASAKQLKIRLQAAGGTGLGHRVVSFAYEQRRYRNHWIIAVAALLFFTLGMLTASQLARLGFSGTFFGAPLAEPAPREKTSQESVPDPPLVGDRGPGVAGADQGPGYWPTSKVIDPTPFDEEPQPPAKLRKRRRPGLKAGQRRARRGAGDNVRGRGQRRRQPGR